MRHPGGDGPPDLHLGRLVQVFAVLAALLAGTVVAAPALERFREWRTTQDHYNQLAAQQGVAPVPVGLKQFWKPELGNAERCTTCHLAMAGATPLPSEHVFAAHPPMPHDPRELGCTVCHGGQGLATSRDAAHGLVRFWDEPRLEPAYLQAGCGTCHSHVPVPTASSAERGKQVFEEQQCTLCHSGKRNLDGIGLKGFAPDWQETHIGKVEGDVGFAPLMDEDIPPLNAYLGTLAQMPRLVEAKMLAQQKGCRGCHRIGGTGGDEGPDLSSVGLKPVSELDFSGVTGPHTPAQWLKEHFLEPGRVTKGSLMPKLGLTGEEAETLTLFALSQRQRPIPAEWVPRERLRVTRLGQRDFPTDGESLFLAFCVACHGPRGEGTFHPPRPNYLPGIGRPDFLAVADNPFLRRTIQDGRPGRQMAAWGTKEAGLKNLEIAALVAYVRSLQPPAPSFEDVMTAPEDREAGQRFFAGICASCHGTKGEGSMVAPPLAAADNQATKTDKAVYGTLAAGVEGKAMGSFRTLDASLLRSLVGVVRGFPPVDTKRDGWKPQPGDGATGAKLFERHCATCHGPQAQGKEGPALANPAFLRNASDGFLTATIIRGRQRPDKSMPSFGLGDKDNAKLSATDVANLVAFLRSRGPAFVPPPDAKP